MRNHNAAGSAPLQLLPPRRRTWDTGASVSSGRALFAARTLENIPTMCASPGMIRLRRA